jgi:hypothetical protein
MSESKFGSDGAVAANKGGPMRLFIFKSDTSPDLRAFGGDLVGSLLPHQFKPWHVTGAVAPGEDPPHNFSRDAIETAVKDRGFQLWRVSTKD